MAPHEPNPTGGRTARARGGTAPTGIHPASREHVVPVLLATAPRHQDIDAAVQARAYELFEAGGYAHGHDLDHWLRAEREVLDPVTVEVDLDRNVQSVRAAVPGFSAADLRAFVSGRELVIDGCRPADARHRRRLIRQCVQLPEPVGPGRLSARLTDGVLELRLPRTRREAPMFRAAPETRQKTRRHANGRARA